MNTIIAITTFETGEKAREVASTLVGEKLAACVQVSGPIDSFYIWQGKVESQTEYRMLMKTSSRLEEELRERLLQLHPYETPQWLVLASTASPAYGDWIIESTR